MHANNAQHQRFGGMPRRRDATQVRCHAGANARTTWHLTPYDYCSLRTSAFVLAGVAAEAAEPDCAFSLEEAAA